MNSEQLIEALTRDLRPYSAYTIEKRILGVITVGTAGGIALLALTIGARPDLVQTVSQTPFILKAVFAVVIGWVAISLLYKLARPEKQSWTQLILFTIPVLILSIFAAVELSANPISDWRALIFGMSADNCSARVAFLSLPTFAGLVVIFRSFAPTHLRLTGAAIGAAAGAVGAFAYSFYCRETTAGFILVWYSLGIMSLAALGAFFGPYMLKWR